MAHTIKPDDFTDAELAAVMNGYTRAALANLRNDAIVDITKIDAEIIKALEPLWHRRRQVQRVLLAVEAEGRMRRAIIERGD